MAESTTWEREEDGGRWRKMEEDERGEKAKRETRGDILVPRGGIEPPTPAFSVLCSTD
jgi:heme-degrading monooxygenase HmoA